MLRNCALKICHLIPLCCCFHQMCHLILRTVAQQVVPSSWNETFICKRFNVSDALTPADPECTGCKRNKMEKQQLKHGENKITKKNLVWMEWLVQYCSLGFDQRQEKARKPRVRQLGADMLAGRKGRERGEGEVGRRKVPIWESGQCADNQKLHFFRLGARNQHLCCMVFTNCFQDSD